MGKNGGKFHKGAEAGRAAAKSGGKGRQDQPQSENPTRRPEEKFREGAKIAKATPKPRR